MADGAIDLGRPGEEVRVRETFGIESDMVVRGFPVRTERVPPIDETYKFDPDTTLAILAGLSVEPPGDDPGLSRYRQVHPHRAGGRAPQLALRARQPRQPHQPHRPHRQGRDPAQGRRAGDRVPGGDPALGAAQRLRHRVRRVRRRPRRRDVRDPARAGNRRQAHAARPERGDHAPPVVSPLRHLQHRGPRRHHRALPRHPADQPGPDGPLVAGRDAQLPQPRRRGVDRAVEVPALQLGRRAAARWRRWSRWPTTPAPPS